MKRREVIAILGGVLGWSLIARAQQKAMPVIGFLGGTSPGPYAPFVAAFHQGLGETGYVEGQNVAIEYRWAEGHADRLPAQAADLVDRKVNVIATAGGNLAAMAAKNATATIPIVFETGIDPVASGLVASFARPGRNLTGMAILTGDLNPKRFELLTELVPQARGIAMLVSPKNPATERTIVAVQEAARARGVELHILRAIDQNEFAAASASLVHLQAGGLLVANDPVFFSGRDQLVELAARYIIPAIYEWREFAEIGGLMSYGTSLADNFRQVGIYVGRVLAGAKPSDLPVQQPTKFELVINLKTAKTLGLTVPQSILARADEIIE
jgi:putative ABC transport system substrate-binding protein